MDVGTKISSKVWAKPRSEWNAADNKQILVAFRQ
jgi:hypothetical protein